MLTNYITQIFYEYIDEYKDDRLLLSLLFNIISPFIKIIIPNLYSNLIRNQTKEIEILLQYLINQININEEERKEWNHFEKLKGFISKNIIMFKKKGIQASTIKISSKSKLNIFKSNENLYTLLKSTLKDSTIEISVLLEEPGETQRIGIFEIIIK